MDKPAPPGNLATASSAPPSLFGATSTQKAASSSTENVSILSSLDNGGIKKPPRQRSAKPLLRTAALGVVVVVVVAIGAVAILSVVTGSSPESPSVLASQTSTDHQSVPDLPPAVETRQAEVPQSEAAIIENTAVDPAAPVAETTQTNPITALANDEAAPTQASQPLAILTAESAKTPSADAPSKASNSTVVKPETESVAKAAPKQAVNSTKDTRAVTARPTSVAKQTTKEMAPVNTAADRDASLLAALAAYGEGRPAKDINKEAAPIVGQSKPTAPVAKTSDNAFDPKRGVVTREPTLSTGELVRRCKELGFFEGLLCRMRVCSNLWGKDPACPRSAAPSTSSTTP